MEDHTSKKEKVADRTFELLVTLKNVFVEEPQNCDADEMRNAIANYLWTQGKFLFWVMGMEKTYYEDQFKWDRYKIKDYEEGKLQITNEFREHVLKKLDKI